MNRRIQSPCLFFLCALFLQSNVLESSSIFVRALASSNTIRPASATPAKDDPLLDLTIFSPRPTASQQTSSDFKIDDEFRRRDNVVDSPAPTATTIGRRHRPDDTWKNTRRRFLADAGRNLVLLAAVVASGGSTASPANAVESTGNSGGDVVGGGVKVSKRAGGLAQKIRGGVCFKMDELQRDLMQERWDLLGPYPAQLRSYVSVFTTYTDAAFPSDLPSDYGLRVALRYEVGRFFASVERLKRAIAKEDLDEAFTAYADMSLHLDRYLRVGGLYTYYDSVIDNEQFFQEYNDALVYSDPIKDPAEVRDLIVLCKGPDTGKTGIVIGLYPDATNNCVVKLDKYRGMREIRVVPRSWAAKRLGEQDPDDVFLIPRKATKS